MIRSALHAIACLALAAAAVAAPLPTGTSRATADLGGTRVEVFYYKPANYDGGPLLVGLHGLSRNVEAYLEGTRALADRHGLIVAMPLFDRERFPYWRYQSLGVSRADRRGSGPVAVEPRERWTSALILELVGQVRAAEGRPHLDYYLVGHSAGGQAAGRFAAFVPAAALRIVVANPSSYVMPTREARFPYGLGGLPEALGNDDALRRYLAQPVTIMLGTDDVHDRGLDKLPPAVQQGATRLERGRNAYRAAEALAQRNGWTFNWRLVEVPGVGHDAPAMYGSREASAALFGEPPAPTPDTNQGGAIP